jgi:hypothetical protein
MHLLGACLFIGNIIVSGSWKAAAQKLIVLGAQMTADGPDCVKTGTYGIPPGLCITHD